MHHLGALKVIGQAFDFALGQRSPPTLAVSEDLVCATIASARTAHPSDLAIALGAKGFDLIMHLGQRLRDYQNQH